MIRALWALIKIGIVVALVMWVAEHPGTVSVEWMGVEEEFHVGFAILFILFIAMFGIFLFSVIKGTLDFPKNYARYREITNKDKGMKALTLGLAAVAAGDAKAATYQAQRAQSLLKENNPVAKLLEAQAARLKGHEMDAARAFVALMDDKDAEFLGVRGLLQSALDNGDYKSALELVHRALALHPKQAWLLCIAYDLEIKARNWNSARKILYRTEKVGAIAVNKAASDRVAMLLAEADDAKQNGQEAQYFRLLNKAFKLDPHFIPSVLGLVRMYLERGKHRAAISIIEKAWKTHAHPGLVELWAAAYKPPKDKDGMARVRWFEKLLSFNPESVEGLQALAVVMTEEGLWGEARKHLQAAETIRPNVNLYKIWARLEEKATQDDTAVRGWLEKAADAPRERVWICSETGRIYDDWSPVFRSGFVQHHYLGFPRRAGGEIYAYRPEICFGFSNF